MNWKTRLRRPEVVGTEVTERWRVETRFHENGNKLVDDILATPPFLPSSLLPFKSSVLLCIPSRPPAFNSSFSRSCFLSILLSFPSFVVHFFLNFSFFLSAPSSPASFSLFLSIASFRLRSFSPFLSPFLCHSLLPFISLSFPPSLTLRLLLVLSLSLSLHVQVSLEVRRAARLQPLCTLHVVPLLPRMNVGGRRSY